MPVKSSISLLLHLLLAGWMGLAVSGSSLGIHHEQDFISKKIHDPLIARVRKPRNAYEPGDVIQPSKNELFIRDAPELTTEIKLRDSSVLECEAFGRPPAAIHWLKDGIEVREDDFLFTNALPPSDIRVPTSPSPFDISGTKSRLFIDCMAPKDEGVYTCVADTPYLRVSATTNVFLSTDLPAGLNPSCLPQKKSFALGHSGQPARIDMWTTKIMQNMGNDVVLFCRAIGEPTSSIEWRKLNDDDDSEETIFNGSKHQVLDSGDLLIRQTTYADKGFYKCIAKNMFGRDSVTTFFYPLRNEDK